MNTKIAPARRISFSGLPKGIVLHILSFLDIKDAIRTCVLSKQWARLWTQLHTLNINADSFHDLDSVKFFLLRLFTHYRSANLYGVRFVCSDEELDNRLVSTVIDYAISNEAEELSINCPNVTLFKFPKLSYCTSLEDLTLVGLGFEFPSRIISVSLRSVLLDRVCIENDIILGCLNLESFTMKECRLRGLSNILICSPKLVTLDIKSKRLDESPKKMCVLVSAPLLKSISFSCDCELSDLIVGLYENPTLESASIDFYSNLTIDNTKDILQGRAVYLCAFFQYLKDVKSLTLSASIMKILLVHPEVMKRQPSPFHNLKYLKVNNDSENQSIILPPEVEAYFVGGSPNGAEILKGLSE